MPRQRRRRRDARDDTTPSPADPDPLPGLGPVAPLPADHLILEDTK